jgi:hypothetical protein
LFLVVKDANPVTVLVVLVASFVPIIFVGAPFVCLLHKI